MIKTEIYHADWQLRPTDPILLNVSVYDQLLMSYQLEMHTFASYNISQPSLCFVIRHAGPFQTSPRGTASRSKQWLTPIFSLCWSTSRWYWCFWSHIKWFFNFSQSKAEFKTRKEAAWAITNASSGGTAEQIKFLVQQGCIPPLCDLLTVMDSKIVQVRLDSRKSESWIFLLQVALNGLENILRLGEQEVKTTGAANPYAVIIEEVFGLDKIEFLQSHENMEIYQKAFDIIERYFGTEEEDKEVIYYYISLVSWWNLSCTFWPIFCADRPGHRREHEPVQFPADRRRAGAAGLQLLGRLQLLTLQLCITSLDTRNFWLWGAPRRRSGREKCCMAAKKFAEDLDLRPKMWYDVRLQ